MNNNKIDFSLDSLLSNHGEDSNRSSIATLNRANHRTNTINKKISIDMRTYNKLTNFLLLVIRELNLNLEEFTEITEITTLTQYVQTEDDQIGIIQEEEKKVSYKIQLNEQNRKIERYTKELDEIKNRNHLLTTENIKLKEHIDKLTKEKDSIIQTRQELDNEIELLKKEIQIIRNNKNTNYSKNFKKIDEIEHPHEIQPDNEKLENIKEKDITYLHDDVILKNISIFLKPQEYFMFSRTDRKIKNILDSKEAVINQLKNTIKNKNAYISELLNFDWKKEYEINDNEIERLIKEYIQINKIPGIEIRNILIKALNYIKNDIKGSMGILPQNEIEHQPKKTSSFLNSINNVLNKFVNKKEESRNKKVVGSFETITDYDKYLLTEFSNNFPLYIESEFNSPEEIKNMLVTFFTSLRNNPQSISNFIAEIINAYAEFVFYSQKTLLEIKEMEIVKNAMHERFRKYYKISVEIENELEDLKKFAKTNKEIKDILLRQKQEVEVKYTDCITQITYLKDELNKTSNKLLQITEKYNRVEQEYENFRAKLVKEFKFLKIELETIQTEKNVLKEALFEFKKYFMKFHLTEDGDIEYIEDQ